MSKKINLLLAILIFLIPKNLAYGVEDFFKEGFKKFEDKKYEDSKFLFQRNIVFNPQDIKSYLYLAKIYKIEENKKEEEKNINTVILLDPENEEANYMLIEIELKKSNYSKVEELLENFTKICKNLCNEEKLILDKLKSIEPKNESQ